MGAAKRQFLFARPGGLLPLAIVGIRAAVLHSPSKLPRSLGIRHLSCILAHILTQIQPVRLPQSQSKLQRTFPTLSIGKIKSPRLPHLLVHRFNPPRGFQDLEKPCLSVGLSKWVQKNCKELSRKPARKPLAIGSIQRQTMDTGNK